MSYHIVIIVGNVGKPPETRYTPSGQAVCNFSVATNRRYNNSAGELVKETVWWRVSTWGKLAETCNQYLKQGSRVLVEARMSPDKATGRPKIFTKQDGSASASYDLTASTVRFLSSRSEGGAVEAAHEVGGVEVPVEEDLPF